MVLLIKPIDHQGGPNHPNKMLKFFEKSSDLKSDFQKKIWMIFTPTSLMSKVIQGQGQILGHPNKPGPPTN